MINVPAYVYFVFTLDVLLFGTLTLTRISCGIARYLLVVSIKLIALNKY